MLLSRQLDWKVEEGGGVAGASLAKGEFPADRFFSRCRHVLEVRRAPRRGKGGVVFFR